MTSIKFYKYLWGSIGGFSLTWTIKESGRKYIIMKLLLVLSTCLIISSAIRVDVNQKKEKKEKKHGKRGVEVNYSYGLPNQEHYNPTQLYGSPEPAPIHEPQESGYHYPPPQEPDHSIPQHDVSVHPGHPQPIAFPQPIAPVVQPIAVAQPVAVPQPVAVAHPVAVPHPIAVPVVQTVIKHVPIIQEKIVHVDRPVHIPVPVEKIVHVDRPVHIDRPIAVPILREKLVPIEKPYPVHIAVPVHIPKPYPVPVAISYKVSPHHHHHG